MTVRDKSVIFALRAGRSGTRPVDYEKDCKKKSVVSDGGRGMKRVLVVFLVALMVASVGCGKKQEEQKTDSQTEVKRVKGGYLIDPVDKQMIDVENSQYSYVYKEIEYKFNSKENMEAFMKDPEKYLAKK